MEMKFKGILLDLDNTLYPYQITHQQAISTVTAAVSGKFSIDEDTIEKAFKEARQEIHTALSETAASHNRLLYFQRMFEHLKINPMKYAMHAYNIYWDTFLEKMKPYDNAYDFLELVKDRKICILSDLTAHIQYRKIEKLGLSGYAGYLVTSEEAGKEKPHPWIFRLALEKMGFTVNEVCMIGDSFSKDIAGAANLGIYSFWMNTEGEKEKLNEITAEIRTFKELITYFHE
ncbi:MAG: HAD family hydrolase [Nitrospirae bacterium]|nr:HAD family hydrolase [Nitrospirota bacterium]